MNKAVVDEAGATLFVGTHNDCIHYMQTHFDWMYLYWVNDDGSLGEIDNMW